MFGKYISVLKTPGVLPFTAAAFLGRAQMSMIGLGAVLLLQSERGSFAVAGTVSAIYALSLAVIGPQAARLIDIFGQRKVLRIQLLIHVPLMAALIPLASSSVPNWVLYVLAFFTGGVQPNLGALVRARWAAKLHGSSQLRTAFAWESLLDEALFVMGPPLATFLAVSVYPNSAMIFASVLLLVGTAWFASLKNTEPAVQPRVKDAPRQRPAIALPGVAAVALVLVFIGAIFGSFEVTTVAFAEQHGHKGVAGVLLAMNAVGSLLGGLVFGALALRASLVKQFLVVLALLAAAMAPLAFLQTIPLLAIGSFISGVAVAPVLISGMALIERIVPASRLTESMSWPSAGIAVGLSVASPVAGVIVDRFPASYGYLVTSSMALLAAAVGFIEMRKLRRADEAAAQRHAAQAAQIVIPSPAALPPGASATEIAIAESAAPAAVIPAPATELAMTADVSEPCQRV